VLECECFPPENEDDDAYGPVHTLQQMSQSGRPDELSLPGGQRRNVHEDGRRRTRTLCHEATEQEDDVLNCRVLVIPLHDAI